MISPWAHKKQFAADTTAAGHPCRSCWTSNEYLTGFCLTRTEYWSLLALSAKLLRFSPVLWTTVDSCSLSGNLPHCAHFHHNIRKVLFHKLYYRVYGIVFLLAIVLWPTGFESWMIPNHRYEWEVWSRMTWWWRHGTLPHWFTHGPPLTQHTHTVTGRYFSDTTGTHSKQEVQHPTLRCSDQLMQIPGLQTTIGSIHKQEVAAMFCEWKILLWDEG